MKNSLSIRFLIISFFFFGQNSDYFFGWTHLNKSDLKSPRGGTTKGIEITLDTTEHKNWNLLKNENLGKFEKDKLAILSMEGQYRVYFDFMESMGFINNFQPQKPYQSWGTEFVKVIKQNDDFISLQHVMVIYFQEEDKTISEPFVIKHWRQDWKFQDNKIYNYVGDNTWMKEKLSQDEIQGTWSQSVYQVDDSPRYQGYGKWKHYENFSSWTSNETMRPLPRRELSVRDDYDALLGTNIQTITPDGWVHEQNNKKVILGDNISVISKEIGLARYQRVMNYDWTAGTEYWDRTRDFWNEVRNQWDKKIDKSNNFKLKKEIDGRSHIMRLFELASNYKKGDKKIIDDINLIIEEHSIIEK